MLEMEFFYQLKKELLAKYQESYPNWKRTIHDFKGREISNFQELLQEKVHSRISEKWFYTHIKPTENQKLPRVDMIDLLCQFLDYSDWEDFKNQQQKQVEEKDQNDLVIADVRPKNSFQQISFLVAIFLGLVFLWSAFLKKNNQTYTFCFVDADTKEKIVDPSIEIEILQEKESSIFQETNESGCLEIESNDEKITFVVKANYFHTDTVTRYLQSQIKSEIIPLRRDDYALMIHIFSNSDFEGWEKRRQQLSGMLDDEIMVFQVEKNNQMIGMDILNKEEFIDRMTLPINSLKNIKIVQSLYRGDKIYRLRFIVEE